MMNRQLNPGANAGPIARRTLGRTGESLSLIGFGGIIVTDTTTREAASHVAEAFERGVNYFDVAPLYGNAEEMLGPALRPYRERCFLACKSACRDAAGAEADLHRSLGRLQTDHLDLYQLHGLGSVAEVEQAFAPGGAMEVFLRARQAGKVRHLGFSAHSEEAALLCMERFDFDSILLPLNFISWHKTGFGQAAYAKAREKQMGILALKAMAHQGWPEGLAEEARSWKKCWYAPLDQAGPATLALRFTLGLPGVVAAVPPGYWELFKIALDYASAGPVQPLEQSEEARLVELAEASQALFPEHMT